MEFTEDLLEGSRFTVDDVYAFADTFSEIPIKDTASLKIYQKALAHPLLQELRKSSNTKKKQFGNFFYAELQQALGTYAASKDDLAKAEKHYQEVIKWSAQGIGLAITFDEAGLFHAAGTYNLAIVRYLQGKSAQAMKLLDTATKLCKSDPEGKEFKRFITVMRGCMMLELGYPQAECLPLIRTKITNYEFTKEKAAKLLNILENSSELPPELKISTEDCLA